jgi:hypothetical protein
MVGALLVLSPAETTLPEQGASSAIRPAAKTKRDLNIRFSPSVAVAQKQDDCASTKTKAAGLTARRFSISRFGATTAQLYFPVPLSSIDWFAFPASSKIVSVPDSGVPL